MLLAFPTEKTWIEAAVRDTVTILLDHAHCEKKAASTAIGFLFRYPDRPELVSAMSRVAREELLHFERVVAEMRRRGIALERLAPSPYGAELYRLVRSWQPAKVLDELLVSALIEARSCERFAILADALDPVDPELASLYRELGPSEERHTEMYIDLAAAVADRAAAEARLSELSAHESEIVAAPGKPLRLHSGGSEAHS